jgi:cell fate regulator YaaT (PSP1 superfamily)
MKVITVRIPPSTRPVVCAASDLELQVGEGCIVDTERGREFGIVTRPVIDNPFYHSDSQKLPRALRKASRDDEESYSHKASIEREGRDFCLARIREHGLKMKLGHVDMQLDGKKLTFFFTAEGRVDFRALVRDLAAKFRTRIELRQIGSRDDAQMQGGCGPCGRTLCCSTWMKGFEPVSIKMAKAQGLSLNPSKISGLCGRLMCCLKYEHTEKAGPDGRGSGKRKRPVKSNGKPNGPVPS